MAFQISCRNAFDNLPSVRRELQPYASPSLLTLCGPVSETSSVGVSIPV